RIAFAVSVGLIVIAVIAAINSSHGDSSSGPTTPTTRPSEVECAAYKKVRLDADAVAPMITQAQAAAGGDPRDFNWGAFKARFTNALRTINGPFIKAEKHATPDVREHLHNVVLNSLSALMALEQSGNAAEFEARLEGADIRGVVEMAQASDELG